MSAQIDHLVFACTSLEQGVEWSQAQLGVTPGPGGEHPLMGTHNRLILAPHISNNKNAVVSNYIEFIAINPAAPAPTHPRWFGLDNPALQARTALQPQLVGFVASVPDIAAASRALSAHGYAPGPAREATRAALRWQITVTESGELHEGGLIPTLIEWGSAHPSANMPRLGVELLELRCEHIDAAKLQAVQLAHAAIGLAGIAYAEAAAPELGCKLRCKLQTPRGVLWV